MTFFDEVFSRLFNKKETSGVPVIHEPLERPEAQMKEFQKWIAGKAYATVIDDLSNAYHKKKLGIVAPLEVHLLESPYANGFALTYSENLGVDNFRMLFDLFKERTLPLGYKLAQADRKITDKGGHEETVEKWYLKPRTTSSDKQLADQRYGNVIVEHIAINRKPSYIRLMVNVYQGRPFTEALPFAQFLEELFNTDN